MPKTQLRNAASVIVLRGQGEDACVLMGQRGHAAAFMPNKFVFPGGAVDAADSDIALQSPLNDLCARRLRAEADPSLADALVIAALRELWEETGLLLGEPTQPGHAPLPPEWHLFTEHGLAPSGAGLRFVFRAVTPNGRPRRFDARFFVVDASCIASDLDDFSNASDELSHLQWIPLSKARQFDLPFITEVVLAEVEADLKNPQSRGRVPYFYHADGRSYFNRL